jgi:rubrerythrin
MSKDIIYREDAIRWVKTECNPYGKPTLDFESGKRVIEHLKQMPSAEPKTGRWIKATGMMPPEFHGHYCCSECGNFANMEPPFGNREDLGRFCPNCGARMKGADDD